MTRLVEISIRRNVDVKLKQTAPAGAGAYIYKDRSRKFI